MEKENQRVALSKRLLKEGIMSLLGKKNISEVSVIELCKVSGINRTTFYRHYQTPHDVLVEMEIDFLQKFNEVPMASTSIDDVREYATSICRYLYADRELVKVFVRNNTDQDFTQLSKIYVDNFLRSRGVLYKGAPISPEILQLTETFFVHGIHAVIRQWISEDIALTPEEVADLLASAFNRDIAFQAEIVADINHL